MSEVALAIGGRTYRVACAPGEEDQVKRLGATIADKLAAMGNPAGPDAQNLLLAALMLADEVHEGREAGTASLTHDTYAASLADSEAEIARIRGEQAGTLLEVQDLRAQCAEVAATLAEREGDITRLETERDERLARRPAGSADNGTNDADLAPALERLAEMLENCADRLEAKAATP